MNWSLGQRMGRKFLAAENGSVAILFALMATISVGVVGGAIDFSLAFNERLKLQASADGAAMAGARTIALNMTDPAGAALNSFTANYSGTVSPTITVTGNRVSVSAEVDMPTHLLQVLGIPTLNVAAAAAAEPAFEEITTPVAGGGDVCILLMDSFKQNSLDLDSGSAMVTAPTCEVHVKSTRSSHAAQLHTQATFDVARVCVEGEIDTSQGSGGGLIGKLQPNCTTADDTIAGTLPVLKPGSCKPTRNLKNNTEHMTPGTYCGTWAFKGGVKTISLAPGVYIFNNSVWDFGADIVGTDVTIYFADSNSRLDFKGQGSIAISAPTWGTYKNLLIYEDHTIPTLTYQKINGGQNAVLSGLVYLPSRDVEWTGNSGVNADKLTLVLNSLVLSGNTTWNVEPFTATGISAPLTGGTTTQTLTSVKLVDN